MTHMVLLTSSDLGGMSVRASWAASSTQNVIQQSSSTNICSTYSFSVDILWLLLSWKLQPEQFHEEPVTHTQHLIQLFAAHIYLCMLQYNNGAVWREWWDTYSSVTNTVYVNTFRSHTHTELYKRTRPIKMYSTCSDQQSHHTHLDVPWSLSQWSQQCVSVTEHTVSSCNSIKHSCRISLLVIEQTLNWFGMWIYMHTCSKSCHL